MKIQKAEFVRSAYRAADFARDDRPEIAFVGRSNVGKSSLMNRLLGRKGLARTSSTPGRTRAVNFFLVNDRFYFVDLPGYGYAKAGKAERQAWAELIESYFLGDSWNDVGDGGGDDGTRYEPRASVVLLVDGKVGATDLDVQALDYLLHLGTDVVVVATRIDKVGRGRRAGQLTAIRRRLRLPEDVGPLPVSARTGEGLKELWREIEHRLEFRH